MVGLKVKILVGLLLLAPLAAAPMAAATGVGMSASYTLPSQSGKCVGVNPDPSHPVDVYDCPG